MIFDSSSFSSSDQSQDYFKTQKKNPLQQDMKSDSLSESENLPIYSNSKEEFSTFLPKATSKNEVKQKSPPILNSDESSFNNFEENSCDVAQNDQETMYESESSSERFAKSLSLKSKNDDSFSEDLNIKQKGKKRNSFDLYSSSSEFIPKQNSKVKTVKAPKLDLDSSSNEFIPKQNNNKSKGISYDSSLSSNDFIQKQNNKLESSESYDLNYDNEYSIKSSNISSNYNYSSSEDSISQNSNTSDSDDQSLNHKSPLSTNISQQKAQRCSQNKGAITFSQSSKNPLLFRMNDGKNEYFPCTYNASSHSRSINLSLPPSMEAHMNIQLPPIPQPPVEAIISKYKAIYNPNICYKLIKDQPI